AGTGSPDGMRAVDPAMISASNGAEAFGAIVPQICSSAAVDLVAINQPTVERDRRLAPGVGTTGVAVIAPWAAVIAPLTSERYSIQFTASRETRDKLERATELLRQVIPSGDPA